MDGKRLIIEVNNLTKKFDGFTAVDNISFSVKEGQIFAFWAKRCGEKHYNKNDDHPASSYQRTNQIEWK